MNSPISKEPLIKYGPIEGIVLLGGGQLLRKICLWAKSEGGPIKVVTAQRHADEVLDNETLSAFLSRYNVEHIVVDDIAHPSVREFIGNTANLFCLSLGAAWIFKETIISSYFDGKLFNLHETRLPQDRGGGGFSWHVMMGSRLGFCVLHLVSVGVDSGDIVSFDEFLYPPTCRKPIDYINISVERSFNFVIGFIEKFRSSALPLRPITQLEHFSTYWPRLYTDLNGWIDWSTDALELERFICAFDEPYAGALTYLNGKRVRIKSVCLSTQDGIFHSYQRGLIYRKSNDWFCVSIKGSTLIVEDIYDDNGNSIFDDVRVGDRFMTPTQKLEAAKNRPFFTPQGLKQKN